MQTSIKLIVFLPLLAAIIAGLGNGMIGNVAAKLISRALERELKSYEVLDRLKPVQVAARTARQIVDQRPAISNEEDSP